MGIDGIALTVHAEVIRFSGPSTNHAWRFEVHCDECGRLHYTSPRRSGAVRFACYHLVMQHAPALVQGDVLPVRCEQ